MRSRKLIVQGYKCFHVLYILPNYCEFQVCDSYIEDSNWSCVFKSSNFMSIGWCVDVIIILFKSRILISQSFLNLVESNV